MRSGSKGSTDRLRRAVFTICGVAAAPLLLGLLFLAAHAATWRGVVWWLAGALFTVSLLALLRGPGAIERRRLWTGAWRIAAGVALVLLGLFVVCAPPGQGGDAQLRVAHVFSEAGSRFPRYSLGNVLPEGELVAAGIAAARWLDPWIDAPQAARIRRLALPLYVAMSNDEAFARMGSVSSWAAADLLGRPVPTDHYVAVAPQEPQSQPQAWSFVFLHGSAGNFACYWSALSPLARDHGHTLIFPSFGFGNWHRPGGVDAVRQATEDAVERFDLDRTRFCLVALSNAGPGALQFLAEHPGVFRHVVLLSARLDSESLEAVATTSTRVLFIHGAEDRRVPLPPIEEDLELLAQTGVDVTSRILPGEDHFLLFSKRSLVLEEIAAFVQPQEQ